MTAPVVAPALGRSVSVDAWRGLAVLLMVVDHVLVVAGEPDSLARVLTRPAMPIFFLLGGLLARRVDVPRLLWVGALGLAVGALVPWVDAPNVLLLYALGVPVVVWLRGQPLAFSYGVVVFALTVAANGAAGGAGYYDPVALLALLVLGSLGTVAAVSAGPVWAAPLGRYPLGVYVGHVALLALW